MVQVRWTCCCRYHQFCSSQDFTCLYYSIIFYVSLIKSKWFHKVNNHVFHETPLPASYYFFHVLCIWANYDIIVLIHHSNMQSAYFRAFSARVQCLKIIVIRHYMFQTQHYIYIAQSWYCVPHQCIFLSHTHIKERFQLLKKK